MEQETHHETHHKEAAKKPHVLIGVPAAIVTGSVIIAIAILIAFHSPAAANNKQKAQPAADTTPTSVPADVAKLRDTDYIRGNKDADVVVIEYSDSDCPFCERFHPTMQTIVQAYGGKVAWVYRFFPLTDLHPNTYTEATAMECVGKLAGNDAFTKYLDFAIGVTLKPDAASNAPLTTEALKLGVDKDAFKKCLADAATSARIEHDTKEATDIGAQGTPFSIAVNQKTGKQVVIPGAYPYADVKKDIDSIL
jgi:protein-disulfide isomerase